ncbi:uncharacterized protein LOC112082237 [Eutrema salsugineum]|uniref:uncharacterized protein LOC112082237 n=1 Tax=Eutrema salsugineum TaxID=72664 RepID=UPI000CECF4AE|nr:uncharacterized protein LOC112082237 [Eutrema salsugineum]
MTTSNSENQEIAVAQVSQTQEVGSGMHITARHKDKAVRKSLSFEDDDRLDFASRGKEDQEMEDRRFLEKNGDGSVSNMEANAQSDFHESGVAISDFLQQVNSGVESGELHLDIDNDLGALGHEEGDFFENPDIEMQMLVGQVKTPVEPVEVQKSEVDSRLVIMEEDKGKSAEPTKPEPKKKQQKSTLPYLGGSKKRMVQAIVSPRKKQVTKTTNRNGEGACTAAPKGPSLPQEEQKL